jgi:hypothetical protein
MRYLCFVVRGEEDFVGERMVKYAIKGRGSWEGMEELISSVCGD